MFCTASSEPNAVWPVDVINTKTGRRCQQFSDDVTFYLIDLSFDIPCVCYFMHTQARYIERYFQAILRYVIGGTWVPGYLGTWVPGYLGTWVPGYLGTWVPGYLGTWVPGYLGAHVMTTS